MRANEHTKMLGHWCGGLAEFQEAGGGCSPSYTKEGFMEGCDDDNDVLPLFCPFCGELLKALEPNPAPNHDVRERPLGEQEGSSLESPDDGASPQDRLLEVEGEEPPVQPS